MHAETLTIEETARRLGIGRGAAYRAARRGDLPVIRVGHRLLVPRRMLDRLLGVDLTHELSARASRADRP
jgi:excisionase family DNA binding protein